MSTSTPDNKLESDQNGGTFSRWQQRKLEVLQEKQTLKVTSVTGTSVEDTIAECSPSDVDMPDIDSLTAESDFKAFMSPNVSETLRKLALRKLFHTSELNICDGLDVYDADYTKFAELGNVVTADIAHHLERLAKNTEETTNKDSQGLEENRNEQPQDLAEREDTVLVDNQQCDDQQDRNNTV